MSHPQIAVPSLSLIERYGITGPRFTSYPTALSFDDTVGDVQFIAALERSNDRLIPAPLSLYVHIPFCKSLCYFCGCHKKVTRNQSIVQSYLTALHQEIGIKGALLDNDRVVHQLHLGGGTPTFLNTGQRESLMHCLDKHFQLSSEATRDFSIEIDPRTIGPKEMAPLSALGFNRASFGIQDFDPAVQEAVNRRQHFGQVAELIEAAREAGFRSVSVDLIYGLPQQTDESFGNTVADVIQLRPEALSVFNYAHLPERFPAQRLIRAQALPDAPSRIRIFRSTAKTLQQAGYEFIGMDHFALPESYLASAKREGRLHRCFQGYATGAGSETLGLGVSAISHIGDGYFQVRKDLRRYLSDIACGTTAIARGYVTNAEDRRVARVIQDIMCYARCTKAQWERAFRQVFDEYFAEELTRLKPLEDDGLVTIGKDDIRVTAVGMAFLRTIAGCFDRTRSAPPERYSSIV